MAPTTKASRSRTPAFHNPLAVFGFVIAGGDGPLIVAYLATKDPTRADILLGFAIAFVFGIGAVFSYVVVTRPWHLYSPEQVAKAFAASRGTAGEGDRLIQGIQMLANRLLAPLSKTRRNQLARAVDAGLELAQQAFELLLLPGYDTSLILELLEEVDTRGEVEPAPLASSRRITPETVKEVVRRMKHRGLIITGEERTLRLSDAGTQMMNALRAFRGGFLPGTLPTTSQATESSSTG